MYLNFSHTFKSEHRTDKTQNVETVKTLWVWFQNGFNFKTLAKISTDYTIYPMLYLICHCPIWTIKFNFKALLGVVEGG